MSGLGVGTVGRRRQRLRRLWIVGLAAGAVTATGLGTAPAVWAAEPHGHHKVSMPAEKNGTAVPFRASTSRAKDPAVAAAKRTADLLKKPAKWPTSANATITAAGAGTAGARTATASKSADGVTVSVTSHAAATAAGIDGALLQITRPGSATSTGASKVSLDYAGFAHAYGGDFGSRLSLFQLPVCALTTPQKAACRTKTPVSTDNNIKAQTLTASIPAAKSSSASAMVLAADAVATSGAGSYQATSLAPSASWSAGGESGDFTWSYPLAVPPSSGGPAPDLSIDYDAQSVDGRLPSTNNQPSWIGEGFDLGNSYIERSFDSCDDDGQPKKYDECWAGDNATLVLNGKSSPLILDKDTWHPKDDDGEHVVRTTGASNGDNDGEFWTVTTTDGTQYVFGRNRLPGWTTGSPETNSTLTVPVYGDDSGEPCHGSDFASSSCTQAWRWNLDYVVDTHHNAMSYWYTKETNSYGQNGTTTAKGTAYDRNAYLDHIDYGITDSTFFGTAPDQVLFSTAERCLVTDTEKCTSPIASTAKDWPDVPFDQICASGTVCANSPAPTFFSRKRLTGITTRVWDTALSTPGYQNVDSWALDQDFVDPGDGTSSSLWLKSITRTGEDGTEKPMAPVTFAGEQLPNRVDTSHDDIAALIKWRVRTITTETGSVITVNYNNNDPTSQCVAGKTMPAAPDNNTLLCYPVIWTPPLTADPQTDYFNKYVVEQVTESDPFGGAPLKESDYTYANPAWHYDSDNVTSPDKDKTWSQWRGFGLVTTTTGDDQSTRTKNVSTYYQGMDGDKQSDGSTRSAKVIDSNGTQVTDADPLAGNVRESRTFNGSDEVSSTITDEWTKATATDGTRTAYFVRPSTVRTRTDRTSGAPRTTTVTTTYDPDTGAATTVDDAGDDAVTGDEQCTRTTYADNTSAWLRAAPIDVQTVDVACSVSPQVPDDVVSDTRTLYDDKPYGTAPTAGDETSTQRVSSYSGSTPVYQTVSTSTFDSQGRVLSVQDAEGRTTSSTAYTPATGGPVTSTVTTDAKQYATTTTYDPARNLATDVVDPNGKRTDYSYDALGRLTGVWLPTRSKSAKQPPNLTYDYELSNGAASYVRTGKIRNDGTSYNYTYTIYDSMLRPRQTQTPAANGGRVITETKYDSRGLAAESDADYVDAADPSGSLQNITSAEPSQTLTTYDGAGRPTLADFYADGTYKWSTSTVYGGDRTTLIPPSGGIVTTTFTDTLGRTTETRQYDDGTDSGSYTSIKYGYNAKSQLTKVTDVGDNVWTYGYDLMGRKFSTTDPDAGTSTTAFNDLDQAVSTTDSRGKTISYTYDELGRKTGEYDAPVAQQTADNQLAKWTYDSVAKGEPTSSIRYIGGSGNSGKAYMSQVGAYDDMYRPTSTRVVVPSVTGEEALAGSYVSSASYSLDDTLHSTSDPAAGDLSAESLVYGYNSLGMPTTLSGTSGYVQNTIYTGLSQLQNITLGTASSSKWVQETNYYDVGTDRLNRQLVTDDTGGGVVQDTHYGYDNAGNPTMTDAQTDGVNDTQCYQYDGHDRLTQAFTSSDTWQTTGACTTAPSTASLGAGPAPYWQSYSYDVLGNRKQLVQHGAAAGAPDTTTTYKYGADNGTQPHTLTSSTTTQPGAADKDNAYGYDTDGNTTSRNINGADQSLSWNDEGQLATASNTDGTSVSYLYDADGNRLLSRDAKGTTLFLGDTEIHLDKGTTHTTATRYYSYDGQTVGERTSAGLQWVLDDAHDTATTQIDPTTQAVQRQRTDPFGNDRGTAPTTWAGDQGFVGGVEDATTGLTHLGARDYDPPTGRFISLDPVLELTDPQQINGYSYAADNPVTGSDPSGLMLAPVDGGASYCDASCQKGAADTTTYNTTSSGNSGGSGYHHHSCGWSFSCHVKSAVHSVAHVVKEHPVIAAVVATAVVVGAVACVAATEGACAAVLVAGAQGFTDGAEVGGVSAAVVSGAVSAITAGGTVVAGEIAAASAAAAVITEGAETAAKQDSAAASGAGAASSSADDTASSGSASGGKRATTAGSKPGPACSFAPQTPVLLTHGKTKPIGQLQAGDQVESADPRTGKHVGPEKVTATLVNRDHDLADVTVRGEDGKSSTLHTTTNHPFYDATTHSWTPAGKLKPGHTLLTDKSQRVTVLASHTTQGSANRFNLTVHQLHTYYVLAGATPVLVHNTCSGANLELTYKPDWSPQQIAAADKKVAALNNASRLVVTKVERSGSAADVWRRAGNETVPGTDIDHKIDLQLGGVDDVSNMWPLDSSVNRSLGAQISAQLKRQSLRPGDLVCSISIEIRRC